MDGREKGGAAAVAFEHVSKRFGDANAVDDVNLAIAEGMFVTIIGSSGCGKTTLLKMVNALVMPDEGEVLVHGRATSNADPIGLRRNIGYAIQGSVLFPHLTVEQNIAYVPTLLNSGDEDRTEAAVKKWMDIIGLPRDIMDRYPAELSGGQAQRVWIAMALAQGSKVLLLDEPTTYLDVRYQLDILRLVRRLNEEFGMTVVMVLHDINQALHYSDEVVALADGRIVAQGAPERIVTSELLEQVYGISLRVVDVDGKPFVLEV